MLAELSVENLLLIERARLRLSDGLNVLTGETGAGKTVLAHALDLLLGGRARPGIVRPGASETYVEGVFEVDPLSLEGIWALPVATAGKDAGDHARESPVDVVLARRVGSDGRTRAYVNGRSATVSQMRDLGAHLICFYGQHEHRKLTLATAQLEILDALCGPEQAARRRALGQTYAEVRTLEGRLAELRELSDARERELDLLEHELSEIDAARVDEHGHEQLLAARERLRRSDALHAAAGAGCEALAGDTPEAVSATEACARAAAGMDGVAGLDRRLDMLAERLHALVVEAEDLAGELRAYADCSDTGERLAGEDLSLEQLEERLAVIERLVRKHGGDVGHILQYAAGARARREQLLGADAALESIGHELGRARARLAEQADELSEARRAAAARLAEGVREQLAALAMDDASFEVVLSRHDPGPRGADAVDFVIAPNPGVPAAPLREIASGGELSRVMLAILSVANASSRATLVFDEVDAGIGGRTARAVGARLCELGRSRQLLCITHLAQIASLADRHFSIVKDTSASPASATVIELAEGEVEPELVRMLGADVDDAGARRHARELRKAA
ncbi:MAG TPA: DNA repair protein RecN [Solirubrobacteraceae bacterium]|nr:DNA repair protein RecN [Solirubrobacteraceae bacterium]